MIPWSGVSCCFNGAALYLLGQSCGWDAGVLKTVTKVNQLKELAQLLELDSKIRPFIVAVSGRVGSETPMQCEHSGKLGVIVEETAEEHFLKHNETGSWVQDSALMLSMSKEVPWFLDDGTSRVHVVGARGATGFVFPIKSEVFEEARRSLVRGTLDYIRGLKMLGVKRIERVLPTGIPLTIVGEAVKNDIGELRIQKPDKGPFYVSPKSLDQLISDLGKWSRWCKYGSMGLTVFGVILITKHVIDSLLDRKLQREFQKRVRNAEKRAELEFGGSSEVSVSDSTKKENAVPDQCVICLEKEYNAVFVPCGHMCCCTTCSSRLTRCPLCRRRIKQVVKTYRH